MATKYDFVMILHWWIHWTMLEKCVQCRCMYWCMWNISRKSTSSLAFFCLKSDKKNCLTHSHSLPPSIDCQNYEAKTQTLTTYLFKIFFYQFSIDLMVKQNPKFSYKKSGQVWFLIWLPSPGSFVSRTHRTIHTSFWFSGSRIHNIESSTSSLIRYTIVQRDTIKVIFNQSQCRTLTIITWILCQAYQQ